MKNKLNCLTNEKEWSKIDNEHKERRISKYRETLQRFIDLYNDAIKDLEKDEFDKGNDSEHVALTAIHTAYKSLSENSRYSIYLKALQETEKEFINDLKWDNVRPLVPTNWLKEIKKKPHLTILE